MPYSKSKKKHNKSNNGGNRLESLSFFILNSTALNFNASLDVYCIRMDDYYYFHHTLWPLPTWWRPLLSLFILILVNTSHCDGAKQVVARS